MKHGHLRSGFCGAWLLLILSRSGGAEPAPAGGEAGLQQLRAARQQLAQRQRRIIFNNDGCDCLYFPKDQAPTVANFLARRTTPLANSQVDAISYCTISSGFGFFTHRTKVGTVLDRQGADYGMQPDMRNIAADLIAQGTDCLQAVVSFCHQQQKECFWSMRMNDTHDAAHQPDKPFLLYPKLKVEHPDWLVGNGHDRTRYGRWSSVDYARPEIRELAFRYIEEVCLNYDVDGIELDFFRHPCFFKSTASGGAASQAECDLMSDLLRRVRAMTEVVGLQRARPILVLVRATDSVTFNRALGLDLERWLREGLLDLLSTTCYFQLNPWETSVALGHKYGVKVYPCLSDARIKSEGPYRRGALETYCGRALNAWAAGADGIHLFNLFDVLGPHAPAFGELGDPQRLRSMDQLYFVTVRDGRPGQWLADGDRYATLPRLTPEHPQTITCGAPLALELRVGTGCDDKAQVALHLFLPRLTSAKGMLVKFNGSDLRGGTLARNWLNLALTPSQVKPGVNRVEVALNPAAASTNWTIVMDGRKPPAKPWTRDPGSARTEARTTAAGLLLADRGKEVGDYLFYRFPWGADPAGKTVVEARVKVVSGLNRIIICNGVVSERLDLYPDRIELWSQRKLRHTMSTTDDFHSYRLEASGKQLTVYVDDIARIEAPGGYGKAVAGGRNELCFGAADSTNLGEACWSLVRARVDSQPCNDVVLSVSPRHK